MRLLARMKSLRGTRFDLFGYAAERRTERRLIADYEQWLDDLTRDLDACGLELATRIAALPDKVRGYGPIKQQAVEIYDAERAKLLEQFHRVERVAPVALKRAASE